MDNSYSVLMSVYHKEKAECLKQAMDSIWNQTIPTDDFVLVCDGPLNVELDAVMILCCSVTVRVNIRKASPAVTVVWSSLMRIDHCKNGLNMVK